jgi:hypothetical protein
MTHDPQARVIGQHLTSPDRRDPSRRAIASPRTTLETSASSGQEHGRCARGASAAGRPPYADACTSMLTEREYKIADIRALV